MATTALGTMLKAGYARAAQGVGEQLRRAGVFQEVPARQRRIAHWAHSLTVVHDSGRMAELNVPWWTYRAIDFVADWLSARPRPIRVFEYGSGASTLWLARRVDELHSVEHDSGFADYMKPLFAAAGVDVDVVPGVPSGDPKITSRKPGWSGLDFTSYVETIDRAGGAFDLIAIDGRAREACLAAAIPHLAADGIIVFDNTHRRRYRQAIKASGLDQNRFLGLTPTLPHPDCTSILRAR